MTLSTLLLVLLSIVVAVGLSFYQYLYKAKDVSKWTYLLAFLRFSTILGLLLLLLNPVFTNSKYETIKPPLVVVVDNSKSIKELDATKISLNLVSKIKNNSELQDKFDIQIYQFDKDFSLFDKLNFSGKQSKISEVGKSLKSIYKNKVFPTVLISDGNQTSGDDFVYSFSAVNKVFPVVVGDTTRYLDLKINQLNANKYAFLKNKFPVEIFVQCNTNETINSLLSISSGSKVISKQNIVFSKDKSAQIVSVLLPAEKIGVQLFTARLSSTSKEKNTYNNSKNFAVEVIDQRTEIGVFSTISHPDLGMLKRSIESNSQRKVTIVNPQENNNLTKFNSVIFYQPNSSFKKVFDASKIAKINSWIITGSATDFNFLNQNQTYYDFKMASQKEDYLAEYNPNFAPFAIDNIGFEKFPPLENLYGKITEKNQTTTLLNASIRSIKTNSPLLSFYETNGKRGAFLFGSNIWKWRAKSYLDHQSFEKFDLMMDKIIQYLNTNNQKKSLIVSHERFYNMGDNIEITAQYFNKNYEFDENASLSIKLVNTKTNSVKQFDLLKSNNSFKVNLEGLNPGKYSFEIKESNSKSSYTASFEVLDFDIEKQFVNANFNQMKQVSMQTNGTVYIPNQIDDLIKKLTVSEEFPTIEKSIKTNTSLIDTLWFLILLAVLLATEWFIRKYKGLL